ncbi:MAG: UDP-N-acetylmuramate--L-alanine ligase, partial [Oscillospiraceae bacterium]|nr:UDP-N-acetylmuramate--L-alanine ligase [Oscillospiraceae bacterium]
MFPLVQILHKKGYIITGSDNNESDIVKTERDLGIDVIMNQKAENIKNSDLIVYTSAIMEDNPELIAAKQSGIKTIERSDLLGYITSKYSDCICISGTHGKTTTTSILTQILLDANIDISAIIGGKLKSIDGYAKIGDSSILVCEACEYEDHFLKLSPDITVILNIDNDHMDYFKNMENLKRSFKTFCHNTRKTIIYNGDDANTTDVVLGIDKKLVSFGFNSKNDYCPVNINKISGFKTTFSLCKKGKIICENINLLVPGEHNILNAVAALAVAIEIGTPLEKLKDGFNNFKGAGRRFEFIGEVNGVTVVDDYGHHPAEIEATLKAAKNCGFKKVWAVHQPFTYSRTKMLMDEFAKVLSIADRVVLTEIMGSR